MAIKTGTAISLVGPKGPVGDQGQSVPALGTLCFAAGPQATLSNVAGSASGVTMGVAGSTAQPCNYFPPDASAFLGATIISYGSSTGSFTFSLVNVTSGTTLYTSASYAANTITTVGVFGAATYPMVKGAQYQWKVTGTGTIYACVQPFYAMAANTPVAASQVNDFALTPSTPLSTDPVLLQLPGTGTTAYIRLPRAGYVYTYTVVNAAAAAATITFYNFTSSTLITSVGVAANSITTFGPYGPSTMPIAVSNNYVFRATGTGNANLQVQASVVS